ncbi:putative alkaline shock family protein YloU [Lipingzhangella halophila]|uniref:Putative alkaline shock family protein YloU n=1 Tax=Lipingzhangella halophila TaxID=1783352 RepID=A0A7W7RNF0_9ACTN|nr:Asp23/Gls24 family envelope stress response protein [Lipingzhangella halophila]MBB4935240.1 putative alkaline shock family protein YloU [Lipingzhangella halophila]
MSTATAAPRTAPGQGAGPPPAERGTTTVPDRVVAKIATAAVSEVSGSRALTGRFGGLVGGGGARSHARVSGTNVTLRLVIAVHYPSPLRRMAREVRAHVKHRVAEYTGLTVRHIDIEIAELVRTRNRPRGDRPFPGEGGLPDAGGEDEREH